MHDMDEILQLMDEEAGPWLDQQLPPLHVVLGDSVARVSGLGQWYELDQIHINPEGFRKMAAAEGLPSWIRFRDGA
ncbi:hypothetical protein FJT64_016008 [Amphibalanus amphitrite]|uniref:Uncharacterized protein n=1 Tax=Amphibalanus amphitrite TaxID=1232801 RepID=A0A6A4X5H4_AMPAM|nr:hypothetical protein FJT64_016008 [Amphibalanus amphitrite]